MSSLNNLLSGLLKDTMKSITSSVKGKIEDVIDDALHPDENKTITIESLYHRLGEVQAPMTGEFFLERMTAVGCEAKLLTLPDNMKMPAMIDTERNKLYAAQKDTLNFNATFNVYKKEEDAILSFNSMAKTYKTEGNRIILSEEDNRILHHSTTTTEKITLKSYLLLSRIENTTLLISIQEEKADEYAALVVEALQGTGY